MRRLFWPSMISFGFAVVSFNVASEPKTFLTDELYAIAGKVRSEVLSRAQPSPEAFSPTVRRSLEVVLGGGDETSASDTSKINAVEEKSAEAKIVTFVARDPKSADAWALLARFYGADFYFLKSTTNGESSNGTAELEEALTKTIGARYSAYLYANSREVQAAQLAGIASLLNEAVEANWDLESLGASNAPDQGGDMLGRLALEAAIHAEKLAPSSARKRLVDSLNDAFGVAPADEYEINSELQDPRVCFGLGHGYRLSSRLLDPARYLRIDPDAPNASVTIQGGDEDDPTGTSGRTSARTKICIDGLARHIDYAVTVKAGLPLSGGGALLQDVEENPLTIGDRSPSVHFVGQTYVLPKDGPHSIPIVSYGLSKVRLALYRIGDRALPPVVAVQCAGKFVGGSSGQCLANTVRDFGRKVWPAPQPDGPATIADGYFTIDQKGDFNADVTSSLSLDEVIKGQTAGTYVLVASSGLPQSDPDETDGAAQQWLVITDIGLSSIKGPDGLHVFARSLATAAALPGVEVRVIARDNEVLAAKRADASGHVAFEAPLLDGRDGAEPVMVIASATDRADYSFLDIEQPAIDLTDRGVEGREAPTRYDPFVTTERGVYRPGEKVNALVLLRGLDGDAVPGLPISITVHRPDQSVLETVAPQLQDDGAGAHVTTIALPQDAERGTWRIEARVDPRLPPIGSKEFLVDNYVPDKVQFRLDSDGKPIEPGHPIMVSLLDGKFLYGAPASDLQVEGRLKIAAATSAAERPADLHFGLEEEEFTPKSSFIDGLPRTSPKGDAKLSFVLPEMEATTKPLQATMTFGLREPGGHAVQRVLTVPIKASGLAIGVKPTFGRIAAENAPARFDVGVFDPNGRRLARHGLRWTLKSIATDFQWFRSQYDDLSFEAFTRDRVVGTGAFNVDAYADAADRTMLEVPVGQGRFRLELALDAKSDPITSYDFGAGYTSGRPAETPETLDVSLGKAAYAIGDTARIVLSPRFTGKAIVAIYSSRLLATREIDITQGAPAEVTIPVDASWGTGAYVLAFAYRGIDDSASRLRARSIGAVWLPIDSTSRRLEASVFTSPVRSDSTFKVTTRVKGLAPGEKAFALVSVVDVGLLNLTDEKLPDPLGWLFSKRRLSADIRDLYGFVIDGNNGVPRQLREGGDSSIVADNVRPPTEALVSFVSRVLPINDDGTVDLNVTLPQFQGTVRINAIVWTATKLGVKTLDVVVHDPLVAMTTLPAFLTIGDEAQATVDLYNAELPPGTFELRAQAFGALDIVDGSVQKVELGVHERATLRLHIAANRIGSGKITLTPSDGGSVRTFFIPVEPDRPVTRRVEVSELKPGESLILDAKTAAGFQTSTCKVSVSASSFVPLNLDSLSEALTYESDLSTMMAATRGFPLVVAAEVTPHTDQQKIDAIETIVRRVIEREDENGAFGNWPRDASTADAEKTPDLQAFVTDFLLRADAIGARVDPSKLELALETLWSQQKDEKTPYGLYVLARSKPYFARHERLRGVNLPYAALPALRSLFEDALRPPQPQETAKGGEASSDDEATPKAGTSTIDSQTDDPMQQPEGEAEVAAALAVLGDKSRSHVLFEYAFKSFSDSPTYNRAEDYLDLMSLITLNNSYGTPSTARSLPRVYFGRSVAPDELSPEEIAWTAFASGAMARYDSALRLTVNSQLREGPFQAAFEGKDLAANPVTITNASAGTVFVAKESSGRLSVMGTGAVRHGLDVRREFVSLDGKPVDTAHIAQYDRLIVVLTTTSSVEPLVGPLEVVDRLPAGFEVEPITVGGDTIDVSTVDGLMRPLAVRTSDTTFTAFVGAPDGKSRNASPIKLAYLVRATMQGHFLARPAAVWDTEQPGVYGRTDPKDITIAPAR